MNDLMIDFASLDEIIEKFDGCIQELDDEFQRQDSNYNVLESTDVWYGNAQMACLTKYQEIKANYEKVIEGLRQYNDFLRTTSIQMQEFDNQVDNSVDQNFG